MKSPQNYRCVYDKCVDDKKQACKRLDRIIKAGAVKGYLNAGKPFAPYPLCGSMYNRPSSPFFIVMIPSSMPANLKCLRIVAKYDPVTLMLLST